MLQPLSSLLHRGRRPQALILKVAFLVPALLVSGCVATWSEVKSDPNAPANGVTVAEWQKKAGSVQVVEGDLDGRSYRVVGSIRAVARRVSGWASNPTRDDVDEELRERAAKVGADAVIKVHYAVEEQGPLGIDPRGKLTGEGIAVTFSE
jgi:uncharacterized protein YbjQ (UPF0145 family)